MKIKFAAVFTCISFFTLAQTQTPSDTTYWRIGGSSSLTFSQVSLTNWAAGGQNSVAINGNISAFANRVKDRGKWENSIDLAYGLIKQGEFDFSKSDDLINLATKYSYKVNKDNGKWFYTAILDFRTQFANGYETPLQINRISDFMAPGYLTIGTGIAFDPNERLSFSMQPITGKFTFVLDQDLADEGRYGVDPIVYNADSSRVISKGQNIRSEFGTFFRAKYKNDFFESKLELFTGYTESQGEIDVNWQNALVLNVTKALTMNAFTHLIYDKDILIGVDDDGDGEIDEGSEKPRVQFKNVIGIGLTYKFGKQRAQ
ncbi:Protein of unknown function [Ekhidna lutea]|uniref:DUF3078 domain-containing protein n=1 Tax=Ekhidna lutea TaxID=447679 RepID=A0A239M1H2_EKHLU|nr:DUF3078 domain-containing protein [Ekhidna lutea]SNT35814.1 Protein of unknown function [Ekhidna lutea]